MIGSTSLLSRRMFSSSCWSSSKLSGEIGASNSWSILRLLNFNRGFPSFDKSVPWKAAEVYGLVVQVTHPLSPSSWIQVNKNKKIRPAPVMNRWRFITKNGSDLILIFRWRRWKSKNGLKCSMMTFNQKMKCIASDFFIELKIADDNLEGTQL